ncbi:hypothetical protein BDW68DRAFT_175418 [Aspergillus falconensis]
MSRPTIPSVKESPSGNAAQSTRSGFPKEGRYSLSYWLRGVQGDPLLNHRTTPDLPSSADIVIIGSGMTGTLAAKHCKEAWPGKSILIFEAREFCFGATGRNAGHCKTDQWRGFSEYEKFGAEQALKILDNEQQTWLALVEYVRQNNVDCDLWVGDTLEVPITTDVAAIAKKNFERFRAAGGKISHIKDAQAGVNLQTRTKVTHVVGSSKSPGKWVVKSDRGDIECSQVVHAADAYSPALEPSLRGLIYPQPHMCNSIVPPVAFEGSEGPTNSYGVLLPNGRLFTINPRSTTEGSVLFRGSNPGQPELEKWLEAHPERGTDDSLQGFKPVSEAIQAFAESRIIGWKAKFSNNSWSGIIARASVFKYSKKLIDG